MCLSCNKITKQENENEKKKILDERMSKNGHKQILQTTKNAKKETLSIFISHKQTEEKKKRL